MKGIKITGVIALVVALAAIFSFSNVNAAQDSEDLNVSVEIASQTWIDIAPDHIKWYNVNPGTDTTNFTDEERSTTNHEGIVVRNIGSTRIYTVWFNATYPSSLPYGTGTLSNYDTANFVLLSQADIDGNSSDQTELNRYYYINKVEYAESERTRIDASTYNILYGRNIPYLQTVHPTTTANVTIGRLRDGPNEYFWAIEEDEGGECNATGTDTDPAFYIGLDPHNDTHVGDIDLSSTCETLGTCEDITSWTEIGDEYVGYLSETVNRWKGAVVILGTDCKSVKLVTWNKDLAGDRIAADANYWLANSSTNYPSAGDFPQGTDLQADTVSSEYLAPGEYYTGWLKLRLPWGIPEGTLNTGTITVIASTDNPA